MSMMEKGAVLALCEEIALPQEAVVAVEKACDAGVLVEFAAEAAALAQPEAAKQAYEVLAQRLAGQDEGGWQMLAVNLAAAVAIRGFFETSGLGESVYRETMRVFARFLNEHRASFGQYGFDRGYWTWRQTSGRLFRAGALEFERCLLEEDAGPLGKGAPILSVHIPSDAALTAGELAASYRQGLCLARQVWPEWEFAAVCCHSWLLSPKLKEWLKPGSGILRFGADYETLLPYPGDDSGERWVFGKPVEDAAALPENSSLQRAAKAELLAEGHIGAALGRLVLDGRPVDWQKGPNG